MGIEYIYKCDNCGKTESFTSGTNLRDLTTPSWKTIPQIGGKEVLCNECYSNKYPFGHNIHESLEKV